MRYCTVQEPKFRILKEMTPAIGSDAVNYTQARTFLFIYSEQSRRAHARNRYSGEWRIEAQVPVYYRSSRYSWRWAFCTPDAAGQKSLSGAGSSGTPVTRRGHETQDVPLGQLLFFLYIVFLPFPVTARSPPEMGGVVILCAWYTSGKLW